MLGKTLYVCMCTYSHYHKRRVYYKQVHKYYSGWKNVVYNHVIYSPCKWLLEVGVYSLPIVSYSYLGIDFSSNGA